jgi:hypothetical protein
MKRNERFNAQSKNSTPTDLCHKEKSAHIFLEIFLELIVVIKEVKKWEEDIKDLMDDIGLGLSLVLGLS